MAKLFYQVKEENFSAKISNWGSLCCLHNTDIESLIYSIYEISVHKTRFALFTGQCIDLPPHAVPWLDVAAGLPRITKSLAHCE